jgi:hypothetical protein
VHCVLCIVRCGLCIVHEGDANVRDGRVQTHFEMEFVFRYGSLVPKWVPGFALPNGHHPTSSKRAPEGSVFPEDTEGTASPKSTPSGIPFSKCNPFPNTEPVSKHKPIPKYGTHVPLSKLGTHFAAQTQFQNDPVPFPNAFCLQNCPASRYIEVMHFRMQIPFRNAISILHDRPRHPGVGWAV